MSNYDTALNLDLEFHVINCGVCGGVYALTKRYTDLKHEKGGSWHCPYCQTGWGYSESQVDKLKRQLQSETKRREWAQQETQIVENRLRATKGVVTRIKNRIGKGVCPCCSRTFQNLAAHMKEKHPGFVHDD